MSDYHRRCYLVGGVFSWLGPDGETNAAILTDDDLAEIERLRGFESACDNLARKLTVAEQRIEELLPKIEEERREVARLRKLIKEMTTGPATVADG